MDPHGKELNDREWLEWFLNHASYIDVHDDEAYMVDELMKHVALLRGAYVNLVRDQSNQGK